MRTWKKLAGCIGAIVLMTAMMTGVVMAEGNATSLLDLTDWTPAGITIKTASDTGYEPPYADYTGNYYEMPADTVHTSMPHAFGMERLQQYKISFWYKTAGTGNAAAMRFYVWHVNSEGNGGKAVSLADLDSSCKQSLTLAATNGAWRYYEHVVRIPNYIALLNAAGTLPETVFEEGSSVAVLPELRKPVADTCYADFLIQKSESKLTNGGFEYSAINATTAELTPDGWAYSEVRANIIKTVKTENDNSYLSLTPANNAANRIPHAYQIVNNMKGGTQYRLSFKFKTDSVTAGTISPLIWMVHTCVSGATTATYDVKYRRNITYTAAGTAYTDSTPFFSDASTGEWTNYTVYFTTPSSIDSMATTLYLQGINVAGAVNGTGGYPETCYDDVVLQEDYTEAKYYDTAGNEKLALTPGEQVEVRYHYVPTNLDTSSISVLAAAHKTNGTAKVLSDIAIASAAPLYALTFDGDTQPTTSFLVPHDYVLELTVPQITGSEETVLSTYCWNGTQTMQPLTTPEMFFAQ